MRRRRPRGSAARDRSRRGQRQAGDRDGEAARGQGRGRTAARTGGWVRARGGRRPAGGAPAVTSCLAVGVMSGTSLDGVSTALVRLSDAPLEAELIAFRQEPYAAPERAQIIDAIARGRLLLNIGGIANVTWVPRRGMAEGALAFDTGPGVAVIDAVTRRLDPDTPFDRDGARARRGKPRRKVLDALLADAYFAQPPPKSTGRERFGIEFADRLIGLVRQAGGSDNDAVATATALTAETIAQALERWTPPPTGPEIELVISGGGARNPVLVELLAARVRPRPLLPFDRLFFDGEAKEALAFAFLGFLTVCGKPGNLPAATGARGPRVLGHVTPA